MKKYALIITVLICFIFLSETGWSQNPTYTKESWSLTTPLTGTQTYVARDTIRLSEQFNYKSQSGSTFHAKIDPTLVFAPSDQSYMSENGEFTSDPTKGASVGNFGGTFEVSSTGAATYNIPIDCPPGINGMQPNIALVYNSQSGDGIAGWGWNISGLSAITIGQKTLFTEGLIGGTDVSIRSLADMSMTGYYLDGNPLIPIESTESNTTYKTENETYTKIVCNHRRAYPWYPTSFTITTKEGMKMEYSKIITAKIKNENQGGVQWLLETVTDPNGNYMQYTYDKSKVGNAQIVLKEINYVENNHVYKKYPDSSIVFEYKKKTTSRKKFIGGGYLDDYNLLESVTVKSAGGQFRKYELYYKAEEGKDFLTTIDLTGRSGEKFKPLVFEWGENNKEIQSKELELASFKNPNTEVFQRIFMAYDINGDGKSEIIEIFPKKEWLTPTNYTQSNYLAIHQLNYNDGIFSQYNKIFPDVYDIGPSFNVENWSENKDGILFPCFRGDSKRALLIPSHVKLDANQSNYVEFKDIRSLVSFNYPLSHSDRMPAYTFGDINNDGIDELIILEKAKNETNGEVTLNLGTIFYIQKNDLTTENLMVEDELKETNLNFKVKIPANKKDYIKDLFLFDFNADGLLDIMVITSDNYYFLKNNGEQKDKEGVVRQSFSKLSDKTNDLDSGKDLSKIKTGDFNGDGMLDLLHYDGAGNFTMLLNTGDFEFATYHQMNTLSNLFLNQDSKTQKNINKDDYIVTDFNQDGKSDLIIIDAHYNNDNYSNTTIKWYASNATSFTLVKEFTINNEDYYLNSYAAVGDFDGDGRQDLFSYNANLDTKTDKKEQSFIHHSFNTDFEAERIKSITDGFGNKTEVNYRPLTYKNLNEEDYFYTRRADAVYPIADVTIPLYCVEEIRSNLANTLSTNNYTYSGAKVHLKGKGFLGFMEYETSNSNNNRKITTKTEMNFEYCLPAKQTMITASLTGDEISKTEIDFGIFKNQNTYDNSLYKTYTLFSSQTKETNFLTGINKITSNFFDEYGNLSASSTRTGEMESFSGKIYAKKGSWAWCANKVIADSVMTVLAEEDVSMQTGKYEYDKLGRLIKETHRPVDVMSDPAIEGEPIETEYLDFNVFGAPQTIKTTASIDETNKTTYTEKVKYTFSGRFIEEKTNHLNEKTTYKWDEYRGVLLKETDHYGRSTSYIYDNWGQLKEATYPNGIRKAQTLQWAKANNEMGALYYSYSETSGESPVITWYDGIGRELKREFTGLNGKKIEIDKEYNDKGQLYRISEPYFTTQEIPVWAETYSYDEYDRTESVITPLGTTTYTYNGLTTIVEAPSGERKTVLNYSGLVESEEVDGKKVSFTYYSNGKIKTATPENGIAISMKYDLQGNRIEINDPDAGKITTKYNAWGQILQEVQKVDNNKDSVRTVYSYHPNGLLNYKTINGEKTLYQYDDFYRLQRTTLLNNNRTILSQSYLYDNWDRIIEVKDSIEAGKVFFSSTEYDRLGRIRKEVYPGGYYVVNSYDRYGYLTKVQDKNGSSIWEALDSNNKGQLTSIKKGNKTTVLTYDDRGFPSGIQTPGIVDLTFEFNEKGNLASRKDGIANYQEVFGYDHMNRLTNWDVKRNEIVLKSNSQAYDSNKPTITQKTDYGTDFRYGEHNNKPHALTSFLPPTGVSFAEQQVITYTDFKKISNITQGGNNLTVSYGVDQQRIKSVLTQAGRNTTRYYLGNYEEDISNGKTRKIHYLSGGEGLAAIYVQNSSSSKDSLYYTYTDYQGSLIAVTSDNGMVKERYAYDPWGVRRNPNNWTEKDSRTTFIFNRGYTLHEHLTEFNLINMNGRMYDPAAGMFFSPDPYIQAPGEWLNYNRYSYCLNNPFLYTDPTGEYLLIDDVIAAVIGGTVNLIVNAVQGNVHSWGQGFSYFGVGAAGTVAGMYGGPLAAGAVIGAGNSFVTQGFGSDGNWDWGNISGQQIFFDGIMGGITGQLGASLGGVISPSISSLTSGIGGQAIQHSLTQGITGGVVGFTLTTGFALMNGESWNDALKSGGQGALMGLGTGMVTGLTSGLRSAHKAGENPWTGKETVNISKSAIQNFKEHAFAKDRHADTGVNSKKITTKTQELIKENVNFLHEGDNSFTLSINGVPKILRVNMQNGIVRSFNLMPNNGINIRSSTHVINLPNQKW